MHRRKEKWTTTNEMYEHTIDNSLLTDIQSLMKKPGGGREPSRDKFAALDNAIQQDNDVFIRDQHQMQDVTNTSHSYYFLFLICIYSKL
jgi:hypothetical protein